MSRATVVAVALSALLAACVFRRNEETRQAEPAAGIRLLGNTRGAEVSIVGKKSYAFTIAENHRTSGPRHAVDPDRYRVTVTRNGRVLVDRMLFVAAGETVDLRVP